MPINRSMRDSSIVDLVPKRTAQSCCTTGSSCCVSSMNPTSFLARANVSLPVVKDFFIGASMPKSFNTAANCGLLANFLRTSSSSPTCRVSINPRNKVLFSCLISSSRSRSRAGFTRSTGCVYIRRVMSIRSSSFCGKYSAIIALNNLKVSSTSFMQYPAYRASSSSVKSLRCLLAALLTSVPFLPNAYLSTSADNDPPASTPWMARAMQRVSK